MIEMHAALGSAVELVKIAPLVAAVYQVYFRRPKIILNEAETAQAFQDLKSIPPIELGEGTHNVTPDGAQQNYVIDVTDNGEGDNVGLLQIASPYGSIFTRYDVRDKGIPKNQPGFKVLSNPRGDAQMIAEAVTDSSELRFFGVLIFRPKGQPVFPNS